MLEKHILQQILGLKLLKRVSTYFISCHDLITKLNIVHQENKLKEALKTFNKYKLLIIDEIGY